MNDIKIKDRETEIEYLRLALVLSGVQIDYMTTKLVNRIFKEVAKRKGKFNIGHAAEIRASHAAEIQDYFKEESKEDSTFKETN